MKILNRYTGKVIYENSAAITMRELVEMAVAAKISLTGANLTEANLTRANLSRANLRWANLSGADLTEANLTEADLRWANLRWANLRWANLTGANLTGADLTEANLTGTYLTGAIGLLSFTFSKHFAFAWKCNKKIEIKIGCIQKTAKEWLSPTNGYKKVGKAEGYNKTETEAYGNFIKIAAKALK